MSTDSPAVPRSHRTTRRGLVLLTGAALVAARAGSPALGAAAPSDPQAVASVDGLLRWMEKHRDHVGLAVLPESGRPAIAVNAGRRFPLASVRKVTIAGALVASGADLTDTVPRAEVERFVLPGLSYGADLDPERPTLQQLLDAMISVSDNASADALLARVGPRAADRWGRRGGLAQEDPIMPLLGEFGSWGIDPSWDRRSPAARAARALRLARTETGTTVRIPGVATQRRFARVSVRGTPAEWAGLMRRVGRRGDRSLVAALDWPRRAPAVAADYDRYLAKGGNLPGVVTEAQYLRPTGGTGTAAALFFRDLPADVEQVLTTQFPQQELLRRIAGDPSFARGVARALRG